ncbi:MULTISPECIES: hypothetical protein [unclassified Rhizobium]|uniref:hypothetical protein n=1 Tax=unclassified Rhizobium TaxID=2613769 RepID=UPI0007EAD808|nr:MULTISPECIES: hypothetical protein [unclassified Rhizobium]ANL12035.1 hypothetical protein AMJ98_PA00089 [Rhizobium sp. N1341]ANM42880.1 hypothetical protein AMK03_PA00089 [Rhizobium sp. N741]
MNDNTRKLVEFFEKISKELDAFHEAHDWASFDGLCEEVAGEIGNADIAADLRDIKNESDHFIVKLYEFRTQLDTAVNDIEIWETPLDEEGEADLGDWNDKASAHHY